MVHKWYLKKTPSKKYIFKKISSTKQSFFKVVNRWINCAQKKAEGVEGVIQTVYYRVELSTILAMR